MVADEDEFATRVHERMPTFAGARAVNFAEIYAKLAAVSMERAEWLSNLLAAQIEVENYGGLIGHEYGIDQRSGERVALSERARALVGLEAAERDRAERLAKDGIKLGIAARQVDAMRHYARTVATSLRMFAGELGADWNDPLVRRAAQRAIITARSTMGEAFHSPDRAGPPLSAEERVLALGAGAPDGEGGS